MILWFFLKINRIDLSAICMNCHPTHSGVLLSVLEYAAYVLRQKDVPLRLLGYRKEGKETLLTGVRCRWNREKGRFFRISSGRVFYQQRPLLISAAYGDIISSERCVPRNNKRSVPLCRIAFLKRHDLSGFQDNSFSFSGCMSGFCNIVCRKWIHQSGNSQILLQSWKSLPRIRGKIFRCRNYMP
jgi:hypothetical protein